MNEANFSSSQRAFQVLIVEPSEKLSSEIISALTEARPGTSTAVARSVAEAQQLVIGQEPELFVLDVDADYAAAQEFLYDLRTSHPAARAIILTASHYTAQRDKVAGLGAIHFLEKPFPRGDFIALAEALLAPAGSSEGERFQGTLSDLHIADIIQLKCISGATSTLEFTGPQGEKARVYFESGQVRHATAPGKEGREAFNQIVDWKGGLISEVPVSQDTPRTIDLDWQVLLMEAVRNIDETRDARPDAKTADGSAREVLVIDDSVMLLSFVKEILAEQNYEVATAATGAEGLQACQTSTPDLILLDYVLPDMKGDEVCRKLLADPTTSNIPVVYMSGFGSDLQPDRGEIPNVIGALSKPFTSESLINSVAKYLPTDEAAESKIEPAVATSQEPVESAPSVEPAPVPAAPVSLGEKMEPEPIDPPAEELKPAAVEEPAQPIAPEPFVPPFVRPPITIPSGPIRAIEPPPFRPVAEPVPPEVPTEPESVRDFSPALPREEVPDSLGAPVFESVSEPIPAVAPIPESKYAFPPPAPREPEPAPAAESDALPDSSNAYFCGDSSFFSLHWALQTISREKLTGILRAFWTQETVELLARDGKVILVTTRDPQLYCQEAPVTLLNVDQERVDAARALQAQDGCPIFITLAQEGLILREPGLQLVQHYGQRLFAQLWSTERVRFVFKEQDLPDYARELSQAEENVDQWALSTLRFVQYLELGKMAPTDPMCVPAYTRDGYERIQHLRLTVAEAQFASQFNGSRSVAQISKNLRLDIKFARLTLFRFLALEIVECWPVQVTEKPESRGGIRGSSAVRQGRAKSAEAG